MEFFIALAGLVLVYFIFKSQEDFNELNRKKRHAKDLEEQNELLKDELKKHTGD